MEPDNLTGITNSAGEHAPWLELYNPSTNTVALTGLYLANNYTNLTNWAFPSGAAINPGQFLVIFADGQTNLSTLTELHTSFTLEPRQRFSRLEPPLQRPAPGAGLCQLCQPAARLVLRLAARRPELCPRGSFILPRPAPATTTAAPRPPPSSPTTPHGSIYTQNFDSLPDPGAASVNTANPVTIDGVTYSLANPYDFAFPAMTNGSTGGLGLSALAGWYGSSALLSRFGATDGDQTTGGQISFGLPNSSNRALGLLATSTTGSTAFGAKFINNTGTALNFITLQVTGEIWRQSNLPKTLQCYYWIDPTATAPMPTQATAYLPALNVSFPTDSGDVGGVAVDGTAATNQIDLAVTNQAITNWPSGAALWLVWQMTDSTGKAQGLAIDNLSFAAAVDGHFDQCAGPQSSGFIGQPNPCFLAGLGGPLQTIFGHQPGAAGHLEPGHRAAPQTNGTFYLTILPTNAMQFFRLEGP